MAQCELFCAMPTPGTVGNATNLWLFRVLEGIYKPCSRKTAHEGHGEPAVDSVQLGLGNQGSPIADDKADDDALLVLQRFETLARGHPGLPKQVPPRPCPQTLHITPPPLLIPKKISNQPKGITYTCSHRRLLVGLLYSITPF